MATSEILRSTTEMHYSAPDRENAPAGGSSTPPKRTVELDEEIRRFDVRAERDVIEKSQGKIPRTTKIELSDESVKWVNGLHDLAGANEIQVGIYYSDFIKSEKFKNMNELERKKVQAVAGYVINRYATIVLHNLIVENGVQVEGIKKRMETLDTNLGTAFQQGIARAHYTNLMRGIALWRYGEKAGGNPRVDPENSADLPNVRANTATGQVTSTWYDLYFSEDLYGDLVLGKKGQSLREVMARLDNPDDDFSYVDRRDGVEVRKSTDGKSWMRKQGNSWVAVDERFVGRGFLAMDGKEVVEKKLSPTETVYVYRDSLKRSAKTYARTGRHETLTSEDYVSQEDIVDQYNRGVTPAEKIERYSDGNGNSELEIIAKRLADALGERIRLTDKENRRVYEKRRESNPKLPMTPKEQKTVDWGVAHKGLWWAWDTRVGLIERNEVTSFPESLFDLSQPQKKAVLTLKDKYTGKESDVPVASDKRGGYRELLGMSWSQQATLTRAQHEDFATQRINLYPKLLYERAAGSLGVVEAALSAIQDHGRITTEDVANWLDENKKGAITKYSAIQSERDALQLKVIRDVSPGEVAALQLVDDPTHAIKETNTKLRHNLGLDEFIAWKTAPLRIPFENYSFYGMAAEHRARLLINETWATDEAVVEDKTVGVSNWSKLVRKNYGTNYDFVGGVGWEMWLMNSKLFKSKVITDSKGVKRSATTKELLQWMGMEVVWDKYTTTKQFKDISGSIVTREVQIPRRRLQMIGQVERPNPQNLSKKEYARQKAEFDRWQAYMRDPNHGIDKNVAAAFKKWMNVGGPSKALAVGDLDKDGDVLPMFLEQGDLLRDKYKVLDYVMEWVHPGRRWGGKILNAIQRKANFLPPPDALGNPTLWERIKTFNFSNKPVYRWGYVENRHPLQIWNAYTELSNGTRTEVAPDLRYLATRHIDANGKELPYGEIADSSRGDMRLYRIGKQNFVDPILAQRGITEYEGWVTAQTLRSLPRRIALSVEAIEYGSGRYIPKKATGQGIHRRPIELGKHSLQIKIPWTLVEKSYLYQVGLEYEDVKSGMGSSYIEGDPESQRIAWAQVKERFDRTNGSSSIASISDVYFSLEKLFAQGKITESEFMSLMNMSGCWFRFRREGNVRIPDGYQGTNFIRALEVLGIPDNELAGYMKSNDENLRKRLKKITGTANKWFVSPTLFFGDILLDWIGESETSTLKTFGKAVTPPTLLTVGGAAASPLLANMALSTGEYYLYALSQASLPVGLALSGLWAAGYTIATMRSNRTHGKVKGDRYVEPWMKDARSKFGSIEAHQLGYAAFDNPAEIVPEVAKIPGELSSTYTAPWNNAHAVSTS